MPYRASAKPREPQSPDVDVNLLKKHWSSHALIVSIVYAPLIAWWTVMVQGGSGPRQVSLTEKIGIAVAFAVWLAVLAIIRARHERVVRAAVAKMEQDAAKMEQDAPAREEASRVRIAGDPSQMRVGGGEGHGDEIEAGRDLEPDEGARPDRRRR